jgi:hypothetical protein
MASRGDYRASAEARGLAVRAASVLRLPGMHYRYCVKIVQELVEIGKFLASVRCCRPKRF